MFNFFHRPESRKYNYKPQFFVPEEEKPTTEKGYDSDKFGEKLHQKWSHKRRNKPNPTSSARTIIWILFLIAILLFVVYKFLM